MRLRGSAAFPIHKSASGVTGTMDLDERTIDFKPVIDRRRHIPEPPPVRLVAVHDVRLPAPAGRECELHFFYIDLLLFERVPADVFPAYRSENFSLRFDVLEPPLSRDDMRPTGIQVPSLAVLE